MTLLSVLKPILILFYGVLLSTDIAGGWNNRRERNLILSLCPILLLIQLLLLLPFGYETVQKLYPLIVHLPLTLVLIFALKKKAGIAVTSVCIGYLCCQLPLWFELAVTALTGFEVAGGVCYILLIFPIFFLLRRFFIRAAHDAMSFSRRSLLLFGSLPAAYYLFDYATTVYSNALYTGILALHEFLPTVLTVFYVAFLTAYHVQTSARSQAQLYNSMLEAELKQSRSEMEILRRAETQSAIYQHDMRHHLTAIAGYLAADNSKQAMEYIREVQANVEAVTPKRFCENGTVNLLCSAFSQRAQQQNIRLTMKVKLPQELSVPDTELCAMLSNGLENALVAVSELEKALKWVDFYCEVKLSKLLMEIKNPYVGEIVMQDGLPRSKQAGHGYGCRSIRAIAAQYRGLCTFEPEDGLFTLRVVLPLSSEETKTAQ